MQNLDLKGVEKKVKNVKGGLFAGKLARRGKKRVMGVCEHDQTTDV
jgi:hypothetical protein